MNLKNRILFNLTEKIILRNKKLKGIHNGESCYVFGNAKSLKNYDLSLFNDRISIACNGLHFHKDFSKIGVSYYYDGDPFNFYTFMRDPYTRKIVRNVLGDLNRKKIVENSDVNYIMDISDYPNVRGKNIFYTHHFGQQFSDYSNCSLEGVFSANQNALAGMIGIAIYLGFKDITLVGCDSLLRPTISLHFYEYGEMESKYYPTVGNEEVLIAAQEFIDLRVVSPSEEYRGDIIPHIHYTELTGRALNFKENNEIVSRNDLNVLSKCSYPYLITKSDLLKYNQINSIELR